MVLDVCVCVLGLIVTNELRANNDVVGEIVVGDVVGEIPCTQIKFGNVISSRVCVFSVISNKI